MNETVQEKIGFVFLHGAGLESSIWHGVTKELTAPFLLVDSPLRKGLDKDRSALKMDDYTKDMRDQIEKWNVQKFVIVAHSLSGALALRLADELRERIVGFVAVGAAIPSKGGSFLSSLPFPKNLLMSVILRLAGTKPPESAIRTGLCNDLSTEQSTMIVNGFVPESKHVYIERTNAAVPSVPKLYVKLTKDQEFGLPLQNKMIANLSPQKVVELKTGHLPMLSDPNGLRRELETFLVSL
ncbi:alpha/beta hydrolase [Paenibacillus sp. GSMTC-2017]|uniref:alpha/beta fold hydrolase n=1 Tax=Paenibacillus sp. GSMTC-2017 TaxID=2794350 RepID=UPI0018D8401A|nr:alpha/beta hydrolase [Paenibacillus sp. GSMTC-2017]MBH5319658.1 alpha/beta hydrolase [Paenibacillus sp. GSMTC-2017]